MSGPNDPPPNKWVKFLADDLSSDQVLAKLNDLAEQGYYSVATIASCTDGNFIFVGGYKK
jgi:hypothetical protein